MSEDRLIELRRLVQNADHGEDVRLDRDDLDWLLTEVERLHELEVAVRYYHNGHGYIERSGRWQAVRTILEAKG